MNADFVYNVLDSLIPNFDTKIVYKTLADAGWMQNIAPITGNTPVSQQLEEGISLWGGIVNDACALGNPGQEWMCYISPYAFPYIFSPMLMHTEQYDAFQVPWDCCSPPFNSTQALFAEVIRKAFSTSLRDVVKPPSAVFSGACFTHCISESPTFWSLQLPYANSSTISLSAMLLQWFYGKSETYVIDSCTGFNCTAIGCPG